MIPVEELMKGMQNSFITGATGFIGSNLAEYLVGKGVMVRILFRKGSNLKLLDELAVEGYPGNISDKDVLEDAIGASTTVYNAAAETRENLSYEEYETVNISGLQSLLEVTKKKNAKKIIHLSSTDIYGVDIPTHPIDETYTAKPRSLFQISKAKADNTALDFQKKHPKLDITVVRPSITIGPRDVGLTKGLLDMISDGVVTIPSHGNDPMSFIHVTDLATALHLIATSDTTSGQVFHVKGFDATPLELIDSLTQSMEMDVKVRSISPRISSIMYNLSEYAAKIRSKSNPNRPSVNKLETARLLDDSKIRELGFSPEYSIQETADDMASWYRDVKEKG